MSNKLGKILIVTKSGDQNSANLGVEMSEYLASLGVEAAACEHMPESCQSEEVSFGEFDLILVLGGDGTFIGVARRMLYLNAPIAGVNLGRVGFLTHFQKEQWQSWLQEVVKNGVEISRRLTLGYDIRRDGDIVESGLAINDVVVSRGIFARLIRLSVSYEGEKLPVFRADGVIVSTPTGSTAYGVSAGGPLLHTDMFAYSVTPICPFLNSFKPLVLPADGESVIKVEEERAEVRLTIDGQVSFQLEAGDEIVIRRSLIDLQIVDLGRGTYFEKLKKHGFLMEK